MGFRNSFSANFGIAIRGQEGMGSAAQIINLTAGYLAPELRGRQVRSLPELISLLDAIFKLLRQASSSAVFALLDDLNTHLGELRTSLPHVAWRASAQRIRRHPIIELMLQDPLTRRGLRRPRGFTPDAVLLDLFYREQSMWPLPRGTTPLGNQIYGYVSFGRVATAMRSRCAMLTAELDRVTALVPYPDVLVLGCAHLRELRASAAFRETRLGRVVAVDQDERAIAQVSRDLNSSAIDFRHVNDLDSVNRENFGQFDFVYSLDLLERLDAIEADKLILTAFRLLKDNSKLWLGSLNANGDGAAWLEAFMNWSPVCRDASQLRDLANHLPASAVASLRTFPDPHDRIAFIEIVRT